MNLSIFQGNFLFNLKHIVNKYIANCACAINHSTITCFFQCFMGFVLKQITKLHNGYSSRNNHTLAQK